METLNCGAAPRRLLELSGTVSVEGPPSEKTETQHPVRARSHRKERVMRMKQSFLVVGLAVVAVAGLAAQAAIGGRGGRGPQGPPHGGPGGGPGGFPFERALQLTDEQREAVQSLREKEREAVRPILEQMRPLHEKLRQALESGSTDATAIGQIVLDTHGLQQQAQEHHKSFREQLVALLTPEQQEKLQTIESLMGRGDGRGPGRPGGPGFGPPPFMPGPPPLRN